MFRTHLWAEVKLQQLAENSVDATKLILDFGHHYPLTKKPSDYHVSALPALCDPHKQNLQT